ncbi:hypothetical protein LTR35_017235 [Friedmanniomyces endolithicus]|nr:hypothetical protein LTR35_017235 [Friedmanniomyces endolithicus]KAK0269533.1 hypothetical protein LTS00_017248 [Friedmanniomyces endolithicus]KAK0302252.1 hypothetical protein LTR01_008879 [Friedmanniomyces endolithicus]KAK0822908.1 hypothetical protein LTR73_008945 [Friedmanniomyces endolithicus]KAK0973091.1 hypothetical protein LTR54_017413 [Friedmanniomyces endolithicus]
MADLFTMGDKHYMHANGNGNGEAGDYLPFNNVLSATTFNDSSNNHSTGLGRQIDDSPDMFTEAVLEESSNSKTTTQNTMGYEPIVLLLWKEMFNVMRYAKPEPGLTFRFTKDEVVVQQGSSANISQRRVLADGGNGRNKRQRRD